MCDNSQTSESSEKAVPIMRNGMDYEPKKTYPPDYSNVPSVKDWQMSPFGNARFDLDEIQRLEKKGLKAKAELEELLKSRAEEKEKKPVELPPCPVCEEREKAKRRKNVKCSWDYLYQPYGPSMVPAVACCKLESPNKCKPYTSLGPSSYADYHYRLNSTSPVIPCADLNVQDSSKRSDQNYIPYGPQPGIRMGSEFYVPMGPQLYPRED